MSDEKRRRVLASVGGGMVDAHGHSTAVRRTHVDVDAPASVPQSTKPSPEHERVIIHVDMDCFYAQVEMVDNPSLSSRPVGVYQKYLIVTTNYVARQMGVPKMVNITQAKEVCPSIVLINGQDLTKYRMASDATLEIMREVTDKVERLVLDEAYLDVTELVNEHLHTRPRPPAWCGHVVMASGETVDSPSFSETESCICGCSEKLLIGSKILQELRQTIYEQLGYTTTGGVSYNKMLAKLASNVKKPNQQSVIPPNAVNATLNGLTSLRSLPDVGRATRKELMKQLSVDSLHKLRLFPLAVLQKEFGDKKGPFLFNICRGIDGRPVEPTARAKSISCEDACKGSYSLADSKRRMSKLIDHLVRRIEEDQVKFPERRPTAFCLTIRFVKERRMSKQVPIPAEFFSSPPRGEVLLECAAAILKGMVGSRPSFHITLFNVRVLNFEQLWGTGHHSPENRKQQQSITQFLPQHTPRTLMKKTAELEREGEGACARAKEDTDGGQGEDQGCEDEWIDVHESGVNEIESDNVYCEVCQQLVPSWCSEEHQRFHQL